MSSIVDFFSFFLYFVLYIFSDEKERIQCQTQGECYCEMLIETYYELSDHEDQAVVFRDSETSKHDIQ